jgi:ribosomal protein S14
MPAAVSREPRRQAEPTRGVVRCQQTGLRARRRAAPLARSMARGDADLEVFE